MEVERSMACMLPASSLLANCPARMPVPHPISRMWSFGPGSMILHAHRCLSAIFRMIWISEPFQRYTKCQNYIPCEGTLYKPPRKGCQTGTFQSFSPDFLILDSLFRSL